MKLAIFSDLHIEGSNIKLHTDGADIVLLPGDIYAMGPAYLRPVSVIDWAQEMFPNQKIVFVPGNHDFELSDISRQMEAWREQCLQTGGHVSCLWNEDLIVDDVRFLGTPLFTDFKSTGNQSLCMEQVLSFGDFNKTFYKGKKVHPQDYLDFFNQSVDFLTKELNNPQYVDKTHVVVTHFAPSVRCQNPQIKRETIAAYWASNLEHLIEQSNIWISGHTHFSFQTHFGNDPQKGHLVSNARGYSKVMGLSSDHNFRKDFLLETSDIIAAKSKTKFSKNT